MPKSVCPISKTIQKFSSQPAIITGKNVLTYRALEERTQTAQDFLKRSGIKKNSRVAITSPASVDYIVALVALWRLGAVACPLNTRLPAELLKDQCEKLKCQVRLTDLSFGRTIPTKQEKAPKIFLDQPATILFTSGSSREPKPAVHSFANHYYNALGSNENISVRAGDRWLLSLPLYHVSGLGILFRTLISGGAIAIPAPNEDLAQALRKYKITHCSVVPTQLQRLLAQNTKPPQALKVLLVGGGSIPELLIENALDKGWPVYITYGLTEMGSQVATSTAADLRSKELNSAKILKFRSVKTASDGEILVKGKILFLGYLQHNKPKLPLIKGWFKTGDFGLAVSKKRLKVFGRKDNMFISGGENIQPEEIEKYLRRFEFVKEAVVVPRKDKEFGFRPVAFMRINGNFFLKTAQIKESLQHSLPKYKIPVQFYPWTWEYSTGESLKLDRRLLSQVVNQAK
ncbi:MAG: o-succinylbenzoate--CoA ligase [Omnitrophica WOR_2 bacterium GWA2_47_8]|nr:MAG: o-succinylbenzoate--CoA ligase [Omnitrophica WOR_2 bacterium GWA2_47_8]